ncbi:MAG: aminoacyl-tRNA hydrolase [bacterium]|nr:aminoacyl-tRNA hydrolase [bacterium]
MKLIVGLGNPTKEYENTRHNIGFMFLDNYAKKNGLNINREKFNGLYNIMTKNNQSIILLKPQSYMNLSGEVIKKYIDYYKIKIDDILIISDDLDLPVGKYKLKYKGSSGGHNGLKNIEINLKTNEFKRLKIGISNNKLMDTKDYVLGKINNDELNMYMQMTSNINEILDDYFILNFDILMSKYNHR